MINTYFLIQYIAIFRPPPPQNGSSKTNAYLTVTINAYIFMKL